MKKNNSTSLNIIMYVIIGLIIVIAIIMYSDYRKDQRTMKTYNLSLKGSSNMTIYEGGTYIEPGFVAYNYENIDHPEVVKVDGTVNTNVVGTYTIKYYIEDAYGNTKAERTVNVLEDPIKHITFELVGDEKVNVDLNKSYEDQGYKLVSDDGKDYSANVTTKGTVNTARIGTYTLTYTLNVNNKVKTLTRTIEVVGERYTVTIDNKEITNQSVNIRVMANISNFDHFIVDGKEYKDLGFNYKAVKNGTYTYEMYDKNGGKETITVEIKNIDKEKPTGTCTLNLNNNKTKFTVNAKDNVAVDKITYNGKDYKDSFEVSGALMNATITIYDTAGNKVSVKCKSPTYPQKTPNATGTLRKEFSSNTLKYKIYQTSNYFITYVWAVNPYNQMRTGLVKPFPQLATVKNMIPYESQRLNLTNKGMIAVNASGFVSDQFSREFISANSGWRNSSETAIVVHEGKVLRNFTNQVYPTKEVYTYGLKKDGYMAVYKISPGTQDNMANNKKLASQLIADGVKYTYGFHPILTLNGQKKTNDNAPNIRQGLCQLDKNNFVLLTNISSNRGIGLSFSKMADIFNAMGCIYGVNLDGGGSTSLYYKDRGTNTATEVRGSSRPVADMLYFVEE